MIYEFKYENFTTFSDLINKVTNIHKQLFTNANGQSQCAKYEEEFGEFSRANNTTDIMKELADMFIVACGIRNFYPAIGNSILGYIVDKVLSKDEKVQQILVKEICDKMNKNQERVWNEVEKGYYKHKVLDDTKKDNK